MFDDDRQGNRPSCLATGLLKPDSLVVKQERRGVDQCPGQILRSGEALVAKLFLAEVSIAAELDQFGLNLNRFLGVAVLGFKRHELGINRQRSAGVGEDFLLGLVVFELDLSL